MEIPVIEIIVMIKTATKSIWNLLIWHLLNVLDLSSNYHSKDFISNGCSNEIPVFEIIVMIKTATVCLKLFGLTFDNYTRFSVQLSF